MSVHASQTPLRALVFDLDGTLIDSLPGIAASLEVAFRAAGKPLPQRDLRTIIGPPIRKIALALDPSLAEHEVETIALAFRAHYDTEGWRATVLFPQVGQILRRLQRAGTRLFIVTNKPRLATQQILQLFELEPLFEGIFTRDSRTPQYASKAEMLGDVLARYALPPSESLMVGDTHEDQQAAAANGLHFAHAVYGYGAAPGAENVLGAFEEIEGLVGPGEAKA